MSLSSFNIIYSLLCFEIMSELSSVSLYFLDNQIFQLKGNILCAVLLVFWNLYISHFVVALQLLSYVQLFVTSGTAAQQATLSSTISRSLFKLMSVESVILTNHLILCCPLLLLPLVFPSIRVFSNECTLCIRCSKYWSFRICPSHEYSELISFRIAWLDLLAVQKTLQTLFQHHNPKTSIFGAQSSLWSNSHIHTWLMDKPELWV